MADKGYRQSWADMNSDDSSMGIQQASIARRKDDQGCGSVQLPKGSKAHPSTFNVVCDDSYAPMTGVTMAEAENRRGILNDAFKSVHVSGKAGRGPTPGDFSCFGFLLPKSDETFEGENTKSRMLATSSEESKLGKRLLSAVAGGHSDFSAMMGQQPDSSQPNKFRKIDEDMDSFPSEDGPSHRRAVTSSSSVNPIAPTRKTMTEGTEKTKILNSRRLQVGQNQIPAPSSGNMMDDPATQAEWQARFQQREKQIELGKATKGYQIYSKSIKKDKRTSSDPQTPDSREMCSKRQFDGKLHKWRKGLHQYDPDNSIS
jgi:hypothetical protein